jgi:hypothetical protein
MSPFIHSFIRQLLYSLLCGPGLFFSFIFFFTQTVGLLGRVISPSQGHYLHTGQHKHRIDVYTDIHALTGIRTHDPSVWANEDSSCLDTARPLWPAGTSPFLLNLCATQKWVGSFTFVYKETNTHRTDPRAGLDARYRIPISRWPSSSGPNDLIISVQF